LLDTSGQLLEAVNTTSTGSIVGTALTTTSLLFGAQYGPFGTGPADGVPLYPGTFNLGPSCAINTTGMADNFWNVKVIFTASSSDPNGFTWQVQAGTVLPEVPYAIVLPLSAVAITGAGVWVLRRRRSPAATG
jgi:hypothetical protein